MEILTKNDIDLSLLIEGTNSAFMNALRRIVVSEVPTMAVDEVVIIENSSPLQDEFLSHRIGLIPMTTDLETYNLPENCECKSEFGCNLCRVSLALEVEAKDHKIAVYSGDMKSENPDIAPAVSGIPVVKLAPEQRIRLEAYARLGKGKDHAKWQPVSKCAYKYVPLIKVDDKLCDQCEDCVAMCPKNILVKTGDRITIKNLLDCTLCQDCVDACQKNPKAIEVTWDETSFLLSLESTGALKAEKIFGEAINILEAKTQNFLKELESGKDEKSKV